VDLTHVPTGTVVHSESERSQQDNKRRALLPLRSRLWQNLQEKDKASRDAVRKDMVGRGERSDKIWTVQYQNERVTYHPTGKKFRLKEYLSGDYEV